MEKRISKLESAERARILGLAPREWIRRGHVSLEGLPPRERDELATILEIAFDDRGYLDHQRLTPEQQARGVALLQKLPDA